LAAPAADRLIGYDLSAGAAVGFTVSTGLLITGTTLTTNDSAIVHDNLSGFVADEHVAHSGVSITAGTGLTGGGTIAATRTINVVGGAGITANANDIALTDQAATSSNPVSLSTGTLGFSFSGITDLTMPNMVQANDKFVVSDNGVIKTMKYEDSGIKVASVASATDTINAGDMNTFIEYTNAGAVTVTLNTGIGTVGNVLMIKQGGAGQVTVAGTATVDAAIGKKTRVQESVITLVNTAANTWVLFGDSAA